MQITVQLEVFREATPNVCIWRLRSPTPTESAPVVFRVVQIHTSTGGKFLGYVTPNGYPGMPLYFASLEEVEEILVKVFDRTTGDGIFRLIGSGMEDEIHRAIHRLLREGGTRA